MFGRIMAVVVAVIVLLTSVLSGLGLYTLTSRQTAIRQENLRAEAREIAYLASLYSGGSSTYTSVSGTRRTQRRLPDTTGTAKLISLVRLRLTQCENAQ